MLSNHIDAEQKLPNNEESVCNPKQWRICAICLCDVKRDAYNQHMQLHGYETLHVVRKDDC